MLACDAVLLKHAAGVVLLSVAWSDLGDMGCGQESGSVGVLA